MEKTKYRIVTDMCRGYEVQWRQWWNPFWLRRENTFSSYQDAVEYARQLRKEKTPDIFPLTEEDLKS
jgi:hypothetical protein